MADYTLDQLRSLWEEGSKAGNFASSGYNTQLSPEGEGGGGQTYESVGQNPNSIYLQGGDRKYSMPTLTRLGDEEGGGYRVVTDQLGGAEHVTYSPEGKVVDRKFYENPDPSHQEFLKRFVPIVVGGGIASSLAGAGAAGAAGSGGFGIAPEAISSLFGAGELGAGISALPAAGTAGAAGAGSSLASSLGSKVAQTLGGRLASSLLGGSGKGSSSGASGGSSSGAGSTQPIQFSEVKNSVYRPTSNLASANLYGAGSTPTTRSVSSGVDGLPSARAAQPFEMFGPGPDEEYAYGGPVYLARGGIAGLQQHEYAAGGRFLNGPGDGTSDSIRANIEGQQEARLADGEFVIPADVVSHIGNGSSKAGAKKLYAMMDKIRRARTGTTKMGKTIKAEKYLPA